MVHPLSLISLKEIENSHKQLKNREENGSKESLFKNTLAKEGLQYFSSALLASQGVWHWAAGTDRKKDTSEGLQK